MTIEEIQQEIIEEFEGFDPLEVWMKESQKRDIKIHIWFESFYVGNDNPQIDKAIKWLESNMYSL